MNIVTNISCGIYFWHWYSVIKFRLIEMSLRIIVHMYIICLPYLNWFDFLIVEIIVVRHQIYLGQAGSPNYYNLKRKMIVVAEEVISIQFQSANVLCSNCMYPLVWFSPLFYSKCLTVAAVAEQCCSQFNSIWKKNYNFLWF